MRVYVWQLLQCLQVYRQCMRLPKCLWWPVTPFDFAVTLSVGRASKSNGSRMTRCYQHQDPHQRRRRRHRSTTTTTITRSPASVLHPAPDELDIRTVADTAVAADDLEVKLTGSRGQGRGQRQTCSCTTPTNFILMTTTSVCRWISTVWRQTMLACTLVARSIRQERSTSPTPFTLSVWRHLTW